MTTTSWPQTVQDLEIVSEFNPIYDTVSASPAGFLTPAGTNKVYFEDTTTVASAVIMLPIPTAANQKVSYLFAGVVTAVTFQAQFSTWTENTLYAPDTIILDSNHNLQQVTTTGTSDATTEPTWSTTVGDTTTDGTVTWTMLANPVIGAPTTIPSVDGPTIVKFICVSPGSTTELPVWWRD